MKFEISIKGLTISLKGLKSIFGTVDQLEFKANPVFKEELAVFERFVAIKDNNTVDPDLAHELSHALQVSLPHKVLELVEESSRKARERHILYSQQELLESDVYHPSIYDKDRMKAILKIMPYMSLNELALYADQFCRSLVKDGSMPTEIAEDITIAEITPEYLDGLNNAAVGGLAYVSRVHHTNNKEYEFIRARAEEIVLEWQEYQKRQISFQNYVNPNGNG
ncbi:hypothetical protein [Winogradskyella sp.]|uniref:hypothetical protein n=1 Tax=Winogradskyella sp. TaxID=1883156 RepID=UPI002613175D|nr:hypothetical protein [Winogradskyella sp.]